MRRAQRNLIGMLAAIAVVGVGCSSPKGSMNEKQLAEVRSTAVDASPGITRDQLIRSLAPAHAVSLGSSVVDGIEVEEWKIEAFHDSGKGRDLFVRFYYFVDDKLVDSSDRRIDYRANRDLVKSWTTAK